MKGLEVAGIMQLLFFFVLGFLLFITFAVSQTAIVLLEPCYPSGNGNSHYAVLETYIFNIQSSVGSFTGFVVCYCCVYE